MRSRPDYGIDSPAIVTGLFLLAAGGVLCGAASPHLLHGYFRGACFVAGAYFLLGGVGMIFYSKVGKPQIRDRLLDAISWRGDEAVLDVGCGRGLLVVGAARRLTSGKAVGVDLWLRGAISGNSGAAVLENARLEGVAERVEVQEADCRSLPFADGSFDVVVSNFVVHELSRPAEREKMLREMARVLKPNGQVALVDFIFTRECVDVLRKCGVENARRMREGSISFWFSAILNLGAVRTYRVVGRKNAGSAVP
jgi:ubiquinone/menaquinone biosynthesis C-methylase UbiE